MRAADPDAYLGDTGLGIEREGLRLAQLCGSLSRPRAAYLYLPCCAGQGSALVIPLWYREFGGVTVRIARATFSAIFRAWRVFTVFMWEMQ